jgi:hypothetical protein
MDDEFDAIDRLLARSRPQLDDVRVQALEDRLLAPGPARRSVPLWRAAIVMTAATAAVFVALIVSGAWSISGGQDARAKDDCRIVVRMVTVSVPEVTRGPGGTLRIDTTRGATSRRVKVCP